MPSDDLPLAGLWRRFAGFGLELVLCVATLGVGWLGWSAYEWRFGRTPAKRLLGMTVVQPSTGRPAGWKTMALREVVYGIGIVGLFGAVTLGLGWAIGAAFVLSPSQQAMWDRLAFTTVVHRPATAAAPEPATPAEPEVLAGSEVPAEPEVLAEPEVPAPAASPEGDS